MNELFVNEFLSEFKKKNSLLSFIIILCKLTWPAKLKMVFLIELLIE